MQSYADREPCMHASSTADHLVFVSYVVGPELSCASPASPFSSSSPFRNNSARLVLYVYFPCSASANLILCPSSPARPKTPAISITHRKLSSFAGMGYVTQLGSASVSMMPIVGTVYSPHSCRQTSFSSGL